MFVLLFVSAGCGGSSPAQPSENDFTLRFVDDILVECYKLVPDKDNPDITNKEILWTYESPTVPPGTSGYKLKDIGKSDMKALIYRYAPNNAAKGASKKAMESLSWVSLHSVSCFDLETGNLAWEIEPRKTNFDNSSEILAEIDGGKLILGVAQTVTCVDIKTGEILWENAYQGRSCYTDKSLIFDIDGAKGLITLRDYNDNVSYKEYYLASTNIENGEVLWYEKGVGSSVDYLEFDDNRIYYLDKMEWSYDDAFDSDGNPRPNTFRSVDASTGNVVWHKQFQTDLKIGESTDRKICMVAKQGRNDVTYCFSKLSGATIE